MTIEQIDSGKVMILLKNSDMKDFALEYSSLSFSDPHSRRILTRLLSLACSKTGVSAKNKKMFVEALPHKNGCLILLTRKEKKRRVYRIKRSKRMLCCIFDDAEALLSAFSSVSDRLPDSELWLFDGRYYLLTDSFSGAETDLLGEFSRCYVCSEISASKILEAGKHLGSTKEIANRIKSR